MLISLYSLFLIPCSFGQANDSIYNATQIKLDIASPVVIAGTHQWQMQHYEIAANVQLARRFFPTLELGYSGGKTHRGDSIQYNAHGGFFRVGCDINPLKKKKDSPHALLVGLRIGTAVQTKGYTDCWGEIIAGCQVEIAKVQKTAFYMGWMGRFKVLFTRDKEGLTADQMKPIYIPGFGNRDNIGWGLNYYLGWRF
ncbi:MAG: hypothetical protein IJQ18_03760 [Paludibacteraceae bacterium]|nr:hypothetical protein [Paludibacteraceae bacterium]